MKPWIPWCAACVLVIGASRAVHAFAGQAPAPQEKPEVVRAESWPKLDAAVTDKVKLDVERLRKARTPEMGAQALDALSQVGAGVAPMLIAALGREEDDGARKRIVEVLEKVTGPEHTRLFAAEFAAKSPEVRKWALRRAAGFLDPGIVKPAEAALERARKGLEKKDTDKDELLRAAIACASAGSLAGFEVLQSNAYDAWGKYGVEAHVALGGVRGAAATKLAASKLEPKDHPKPNDPALKAADRARIVGTLRLLAGCGDDSAVAVVKPFLDSNDNTVRIAAINAVRALLDHEPPLVDLPVFDAVEMAKKLKARL
ncbi:MAG: hypothetical protein IT453_02360 [Planctomycetes bacterium]|nr:hypothetical protein [Planctomycetota bacterium]